jgi:DNA modification methylase
MNKALDKFVPTYECDPAGVSLILGDCLEVLAAMEDGSVDHVFTDPPYEAHMHNAKKGARGRRIRNDGHVSPKPLDFESIEGVRESVAREIVRICSGWALVFCTPEGVAPWRDALEEAGAKYKRACVWVKPDSAPQFNGQCPAMGAEMFVAAWCGKGHSRWNGGGRRNVFVHHCRSPHRDGRHPTEKPLGLMAELTALFSNPGDLICDPFMGSGSTGLAARGAGRRFLGVEISPDYFEVARDRMTRPDLWVSAPPQIQEVLF